MKYMRAAVFSSPGEPLRVVDKPIPQIAASEMLMQVSYCGICGTDIHATREGPFLVPPDTILGHEFCGRIAELGSAVQDGEYSIGDRIVSLPYIGDEFIGFGKNPGGFGEYIKVSPELSLKIPDELEDREAVLVEPMSVGLNAVNKAGNVAGMRVLVIGGGPIGLACALWCRQLGAEQVLLAECISERMSIIQDFNFGPCLDANGDVTAQFYEIAGSAPDIQFECVGAPGILQQCIKRAPPKGLIVGVGVCDKTDEIEPLDAILKELCIKWVLGYDKSDFVKSLNALLNQDIAPSRMVTDVISLNDLPRVFERLRSPEKQCKVLVKLQDNV